MTDKIYKIKKIALTKLLKLEVAEFVSAITEAIEKNNPAHLKLEDAIVVLKEQYVKTNELKPPYGKHRLSEAIDRLHKKRLRYAAAISRKMLICINLYADEKPFYLEVAHSVVKENLHHLRKNNRPVMDRRVSIFLRIVKEDPKIKETFTKLGFNSYIESLQKTQDKLYDLTNTRYLEISQRPKGVTPAIRDEALHVVRSVFAQIDLCQFRYKDKDKEYKQLIYDINTVIAKFNSNINTRSTRLATRKRKKSIAKTEQQNKTTQPSNPSERKTNKDAAILPSKLSNLKQSDDNKKENLEREKNKNGIDKKK